MAVYQGEDRLRLRRLRSEKAIQAAMQNRWEEAAQLNRQFLELFPNDVDASNRLGKALMELGRYAEAREAYGRAAKLDPSNTISQKNLAKLAKLADEGAAAPPPTPVDPRLFIEESGKTAVTSLVDVGTVEVVAKLNAGDMLELRAEANVVKLYLATNEPVGQLEPRIGQRVIRLIGEGNRYSAAVMASDDTSVRVILREMYKSPSMGTRPSFPTSSAELGRAYTREGAFRPDVEEEGEDGAEEAEDTLGFGEVNPDEQPIDEAVLEEEEVE
ncbi:MAG: tetratricopeptide repeat protein [Chloroflexi bacterium]|nr:tetratricopeptide repeat protein [Chloroflexota bacterium]